ncbi:MAG TPA: hypothetical protein DCQ64_29295 [Candidatus Rokubacteria bacterium]|nr:MAG: hypothetical protein A2X50_01490 [Candidatus Rokubacteria bacterium GWF2_70_14]HAM59282.1 hypothetical protein [Candidatus Rokubacteria bacterium]
MPEVALTLSARASGSATKTPAALAPTATAAASATASSVARMPDASPRDLTRLWRFASRSARCSAFR